MDPNKLHVSRLEALPQDLLGEIVKLVGAQSPDDYYNCILSCKELGLTAEDERVCKSLSLAPLVKKPLSAKKYPEIMARCLRNSNPDAHYMKGILEYFHLNKKYIGLHHLSVAAKAGHKEAIYAYAQILLCSGNIEKGKKYFMQLNWGENIGTINKCWENMKNTLKGIKMVRRKCYLQSLGKMKPSCHLGDVDITCDDCFYYKQMFKFIYMI